MSSIVIPSSEMGDCGTKNACSILGADMPNKFMLVGCCQLVRIPETGDNSLLLVVIWDSSNFL